MAPEKKVAKKSRAMVQTMRGVVKTKLRPERSASRGDSRPPPSPTRPEVRMVARAPSTKAKETAFSA